VENLAGLDVVVDHLVAIASGDDARLLALKLKLNPGKQLARHRHRSNIRADLLAFRIPIDAAGFRMISGRRGFSFCGSAYHLGLPKFGSRIKSDAKCLHNRRW